MHDAQSTNFTPTAVSTTAIAVRNSLVANATANKVINPGAGSPNRLLYMGFIL